MERKIALLSQLSSAGGEKDEAANLALANALAEARDKAAIEVLVDQLTTAKLEVRSDCIKVLYEIGAIYPELIAPHLETFFQLLTHRNNRLQWGAMTALARIAPLLPEKVFDRLDEVLAAVDQGSVITRDQAVNILISLMEAPAYSEETCVLLLEQLRTCPPNQLPMYAERAQHALPAAAHPGFIQLLAQRLPELGTSAKQKRVEKVISYLEKRGGGP